jgi:hypothetical protein
MLEKEKLWKKMADLTYIKCKDNCKQLGMCCSKEYCAYAYDEAKEHGIELNLDTSKDLPGIGDTGKCIIPPMFRPLCSLHICDRLLFSDVKFSEEYFELREILSGLEESQLS